MYLFKCLFIYPIKNPETCYCEYDKSEKEFNINYMEVKMKKEFDNKSECNNNLNK